MGLYYVGLKESDIVGVDIFDGYITYFGSGKNKNMSLNSHMRQSINHNDETFDDYFNYYTRDCVKEIYKKDKEAKFVYYNQSYFYKHKDLFDFDGICANKRELIDNLNNKFYAKDLLKSCVPVLEHTYMNGKDINLKNLNKLYDGECEKWVIQASSGAGGSGTYVIDKGSIKEVIKSINKDASYQVTKYLDNLSINTHIVIGENDIIVFPFSIQLIKNINNRLSYIGGDFSSYETLINNNIKKLAYDYSMNIAKKLKEMGWIGVVGIDYLVTDNEVYFMEVNPRFQSSSRLLNNNLLANGCLSLHEYNTLAFEGKRLPKLEEIKARGAFVNRTYNDGLTIDAPVVDVYEDGYVSSYKIDNGTYMYAEVFDVGVVGKIR